MKKNNPLKEEEVQVEPEEQIQDKSQEEVQVELEKKEEPKDPEWKKEIDAVKLENEKYKARMEFQARQLEKAQRDFAEATKRIPNTYLGVNEKEKEDDNEYDSNLDNIAKENYQKAVRILARKEAENIAEKKFKELFEKQNEIYNSQARQLQLERILEKSKQEVIEEYPEILDNTSEKSMAYARILEEDQNLLSDPYGPIVAMKRMEKILKQNGNSELERFKRAAASTTPKGVSPGNGKSITITREQEQFCKENGISVEKYARSLKALEAGGVTV